MRGPENIGPIPLPALSLDLEPNKGAPDQTKKHIPSHHHTEAPPTPTTHTTLAHHTHHAGTHHAQQCIATTSSILKSTHHIGRQLHLLHKGDAQAAKGHLLVLPRGKVQRTTTETRLDLAPPGGVCPCAYACVMCGRAWGEVAQRMSIRRGPEALLHPCPVSEKDWGREAPSQATFATSVRA